MEHYPNNDPLSYDIHRSAFTISKGERKKESLSFETFAKALGRTGEEEINDLFKPLRPVLIVGRILGLIPISGVFKHSYTDLTFRRKSLAAVISLVITSILTVNLVLALIQWVRAPKRNALQIAQSIHSTAQYCWGWAIYISFLVRGEKFLNLFKKWAKSSASIFYSIEDKKLRRDCIFICVLILTSCILENAVLHLEYFKELDYMSGVQIKYKNVTNATQSWLETYYWRSNFHWANVFGYNGFFAVLAFLQHKFMLYTWNYMDVILAVFGRALYFKFKSLYDLSSHHLADPLKASGHSHSQSLEMSNNKSNKVMNKQAWMQIVNDHKTLYDLLQEIEEFFSPLVFGSYAVNIYYICIQLLIGLSPDISVTSPVQQVYGPWSFIHMAIRIYIVSLCIARINLYAHQLRTVFADCPIEIYKGEIARVDKRITAGPSIGMTGMQCFVVTYPFLLSIVAVIFTFEIVLLQGTSTPTGGQDSCCCPSKS